MGTLSEFQRGQIVGAQLSGASVIKTDISLGVSRAAVSKVPVEYPTHGKTSSAKRKPKTKRRGICLTIIELLQQGCQQNSLFILKTLFPQQQSDESFTNPTSKVQLRLVTENNATRSKRRSDIHKTWTAYDLKNVIWSDESSLTLFPTSGRVYVWRTAKEAYTPEFLVPTAKYGAGSATVWVAIFWCTAGSIITMNGRITASGYVDILGNLGHPMVPMLFPNNYAIFQDDNWIIHTARRVHSWFQEHGDALTHIP